MSVGVIEALTEAIGQADSEIGGYRLTRLDGAVSAGATSIIVESTLGWDTTGVIGIDGIVYNYTGGGGSTTLSGISYEENGVTVNGLKQDHADASSVLDLNRSWSALDLVRRSLLINYAEGIYLDAIGRNLNVNRNLFLRSDALYRGLIKALAYNPRGTLYGLTLALDALVGSGNYEILEDPINSPGKVLLKFLGALSTTDEPQGKTFLEGRVIDKAASTTTVDIGITPEKVGSVQYKPEDFLTDCRTAKPSADVRTDYPGDPGTTLWTYQGINEATEVTIDTSEDGFCVLEAVSFGGAVYYGRTVRLQPQSYAALGWTVRFESGKLDSTTGWVGIYMEDGQRAMLAGHRSIDANTFRVQFCDTVNAFPITVGAGTILNYDTWYHIEIRKYGEDHADLLVDGQIVERLTYTDFDTDAGTSEVFFGDFAGINPPYNYIALRNVNWYCTTPVEYNVLRNNNGSEAAANPTRFTLASPAFVSGDVGKSVLLSGRTATNAQGGTNNGRYVIATYIDASNVTLDGLNGDEAIINGAFPQRITMQREDAFVYPDDLGKQIIISGSSLGNNGTYTIGALLEPGTLTDLDDYDTQIETKTNICEITSGTLVSETELDWQLKPVFVTDSGDYVMSDATTFAGTTVTLRQALPYVETLATLATQVLSAQLLEDIQVRNTFGTEYDYWPFYLTDPLAVARAYLDDVTAAGVIPEYLTE